MPENSPKLCLISSHGGHLHELTQATRGVAGRKYWVTYKTKHTRALLAAEKHYFVIDPCTNKFKYLVNALQSLWHLTRERPDVIISTGAGIAVPTMILGKFVFRAKIIYVESAAAVIEPSKTGRFIYRYADLFLIQWETLRPFYPKAIHTGIL